VEAGGGEDCADCHYEHVGSEYITDLTNVPPHPPREIELSGVHSPLRCGECHWSANVSNDCSFCHEEYISGTHEVGFTNKCDLCHIQSVWDVEYDHAHEKAECAECHGSDPDHALPGYLEFTEDCQVCHAVDVWLLPEFDHDGINGTCQLCHPSSLDPAYAGKAEDCDNCHTNTSWWPQTVDHERLEPPCIRCHEDDLPAEHLSDREMAPLECDSCHIAGTSWLRVVNHTLHEQPCIQCHGAQPDLHGRAYADDCQWCHLTDRRDLLLPHPDQSAECTMCHRPEHLGGAPEFSVDARHATQCPDCHVAGEGWDIIDVDHNALGADCYSCHQATHGAIGGWQVACQACHATEWWVPVVVDHDILGEDCLACHQTIHPNGKDQFIDECTLCHNTDSWLERTWDHDLANQSAIDCVNCHDDIHKGTLGIVCEDCHTTDTWETDVINP
jgi:hypothetical protein